MSLDLVAKGFLQGSVLACAGIPSDVLSDIQAGISAADIRKDSIKSECILIVLSQDCDLANPNERYVEIAIAEPRKPKKVSPTLKSCRSYQKLQMYVDELNQYYELKAEKISMVQKTTLENLSIFLVLSDKNKQVAIDWRVGRYNRKAFPEDFNRFFVFDYLKGNDESGKKLAALFLKYREDILDLFVYVDPMTEGEADYSVSFVAVVVEDCSDEVKEQLLSQLKEHCEILDGRNDKFSMIQMSDECDNVNDVPLEFVMTPREFTLFDATVMQRLNLDYICHEESNV